ncbi:MAG TPA: NADH-quinone oxidoreductase subunit C [Anaerolineaceae bacterium]|nr:NADH-quinone oxidoreductase subunit C [Anaerolineaceae bacterium]
MDTQTAFQEVTDLLQPWARWTKQVQPNLLTVSISRAHLLPAVKALIDARWGYLSAITGLHLPLAAALAPAYDGPEPDPLITGGSFVVLYHFCNGDAVLNLRVHPPSIKDTRVPSICGLIPSATLYERELMEMFGIEVEGTPDTSHLLLPDEWPDGVYPLRKDYHGPAAPAQL